jgi:hypothetical protein
MAQATDERTFGPARDGDDPFDGDSWFEWDPDPARAFADHDPTRDPYASMSREQLLAAMRDAHGGRQWEFLREFLLDRCAADELTAEGYIALLRDSLGPDPEDISFLLEVGGLPTRVSGCSGGLLTSP